MTTEQSRILSEFKDLDFNDKRLNNRFQNIMSTLEQNPSGLITKAFNQAKDQKAAYRFLNNANVSYSTMLRSHQKRVNERCKKKNTILAVHDSTTISLSGASKVVDNIGNLKEGFPGLNIHTTILLTPNREILGISDIHLFDRKLVGKDSRIRNNKHALEKETGKWLRAVSNTREEIDNTQELVWIADREGDFWDYFETLEANSEKFVQRVVHKRLLYKEHRSYFSYVQNQPKLGNYIFEVDSHGGNKARARKTVTCEIRSSEVVLEKPRSLSRNLKMLPVRVIHVLEVKEEKPLEWFLITNIKCDTYEDILEKVHWYQARWTIEELHKVVKSGCGIEEIRLESRNKILKYLLLLFIVGIRILWMTKLAKYSGDTDCRRVFSEEEWRLLYIHKNRKPPPLGYTPTVKEAVRLLGILGGFYAYNTKRDPGVMTIWRGIHRLWNIMDALTILKEHREQDVGNS